MVAFPDTLIPETMVGSHMLSNKKSSKEVHSLENDNPENQRQRILKLNYCIITHFVTALSFLTNKDCGISCITSLFGHFSVCLYKKQMNKHLRKNLSNNLKDEQECKR